MLVISTAQLNTELILTLAPQLDIFAVGHNAGEG